MRITPADAGTSHPRFSVLLRSSDHPRGCGDKIQFSPFASSSQGSPPRMRGQAAGSPMSGPGSRITPADAGTSFKGSRTLGGVQDHPRGCGDKLQSPLNTTANRGSPPRMRGQVGKRLTHYKLPRITPADAGTRAVKRTFCFSFRDHPRGCGDKCQVRERSYLQQGSPPRMRGQVSIYLSVTIWSGITPADAGTSVICSKQPRLAWDHPRGCGDKMVCSFFCVCLTDHPRGCGDKVAIT